jgi:hypothetical protein
MEFKRFVFKPFAISCFSRWVQNYSSGDFCNFWYQRKIVRVYQRWATGDIKLKPISNLKRKKEVSNVQLSEIYRTLKPRQRRLMNNVRD